MNIEEFLNNLRKMVGKPVALNGGVLRLDRFTVDVYSNTVGAIRCDFSAFTHRCADDALLEQGPAEPVTVLNLDKIERRRALVFDGPSDEERSKPITPPCGSICEVCNQAKATDVYYDTEHVASFVCDECLNRLQYGDFLSSQE